MSDISLTLIEWSRMAAWMDLAIMSLTFFLSIIYNIEVGVVVSLVLSLLLVVHRSSKPRMTILVSGVAVVGRSSVGLYHTPGQDPGNG